ncbi:MAG TPA: hypothetical protein VNN72_07435 [Polyangiaceae bacterium]|nr:hypothetical protein [Polyangiaceae bacterium]
MNDSPGERAPRAKAPFDRDKEHRPRANGRLDQLEAGRRSAKDWVRDARATLERHPGILVGAGAAAAVAFGVLVYVRAVRHRKQRQREALVAIATRLLGPAYVVEPPPPPRPSVIKDTLKHAGGALATAVGRELGRRALRAVAEGAAGSERHE